MNCSDWAPYKEGGVRVGHRVKVEIADSIAVVTIDHPPLQILSSILVQELRDTWSALAHNAEVMVVVVTGSGDQAFMAGADIKQFPEWIGRDGAAEFASTVHDMLNDIERLPKPVIAAVNGLALGAGCELALACDMRIVEAHALMGLPEVKLGLMPGGGGTQRLPRLAGRSAAKLMMYTGDPIPAEEAYRIGLADRIVPSGHAVREAKKLANRMSRHSLQVLSRIKHAVDQGIQLPNPACMALEIKLFDQLFRTDDAREGIQAFLEKRNPVFHHS